MLHIRRIYVSHLMSKPPLKKIEFVNFHMEKLNSIWLEVKNSLKLDKWEWWDGVDRNVINKNDQSEMIDKEWMEIVKKCFCCEI